MSKIKVDSTVKIINPTSKFYNLIGKVYSIKEDCFHDDEYRVLVMDDTSVNKSVKFFYASFKI